MPTAYPEQIDLPFNFAAIAGGFSFRHPASGDPGGPGYWIVLQGGCVVLQLDGERPSLPRGERPGWLPERTVPLCIGTWQGLPLRVAGMPADQALPPGLAAEAFNATNQLLDPITLTLAGLGRQIRHWERQSRYCSRCGGTTDWIAGGWGRRCAGCAAEHFPHIHPCTIVLVVRDNQILLTRKAEWAPGRYGLVAGFVDFGESLEECAIREVREETGIEIRNVRYLGSQNWPFPAQLMAGFVAEYAGGDIRVDPHELEDARWFDRDSLPALPPPRSIARWIIDHFISTGCHPI